jgi:hypothetical protein
MSDPAGKSRRCRQTQANAVPRAGRDVKFNTPLIILGAGLIGAGAASAQVTGDWFSGPSEIWPHMKYVAVVFGAFGVICGLASAGLNSVAK